MMHTRAVVGVLVATLGLGAARSARADDAAAPAPRQTVGATPWLSLRGRTTIGVDLHGAYRVWPARPVQVVYGLGLGHIGFACDSGDDCDARELRAFVGGGLIRCAGPLCATAAVALTARRTRTLTTPAPAPDHAAIGELRAALEVGRRVRLRLGGRLETSTPPSREGATPATLRPVAELGVTGTF